MPQTRDDANLAMEAFCVHRGFSVSHDLQGHRSIVLEIVREVYRGHAASAKLAVHTISVAQCAADPSKVGRLSESQMVACCRGMRESDSRSREAQGVC